MPDAYEQAKRQQRHERERVARRWTVVSGVAVGVLLVALAIGTFLRMAWRRCGAELFGWSARSCTLTETWTWLKAGTSTEFLEFLGIAVLTAILIQLYRSRN